MIFKRSARLGLPCVFKLAAIFVSCSGSINSFAEAQTAPARQATSAAQGPPSGRASDIRAAADAIGQIIALNTRAPKKICPEITPFLRTNPESASEVIDRAQATPVLLKPLCACLAKMQSGLKASDRAGANAVIQAVAESSPAFQACFALSSSSEGRDGDGSQVVTSGRDVDANVSRGGPYSPGIGLGADGFSGGFVSPN